MQEYSFKKMNKKGHMGIIENVNSIKKILFSVSGSGAGENNIIGIDFDNKALYYNMNVVSMGVCAPTLYIDDNDIDMIKSMIAYFKVKDWQVFYEDIENQDIMDGFSWSITLLSEDLVVEKHTGCGTQRVKVTPPGFAEFEKIMFDLATDKVKL